MARLIGVDLPREKRVEVGLTYIFGVGKTRAQETLAATGINPDTRVRDLSDDELVEAIDAAPADTLFAIFTHSHDLDFRLTRAVLARGDFRYLGLIGSQTKRRRFERRLRDDGVAEADLPRLTCPIGIAELKSKAPAVIAVSLAAELLKLTEDVTA